VSAVGFSLELIMAKFVAVFTFVACWVVLGGVMRWVVAKSFVLLIIGLQFLSTPNSISNPAQWQIVLAFIEAVTFLFIFFIILLRLLKHNSLPLIHFFDSFVKNCLDITQLLRFIERVKLLLGVSLLFLISGLHAFGDIELIISFTVVEVRINLPIRIVQ